MRDASGSSDRIGLGATLAFSVAVNVAFILPSSLVGVLAVQMRASLGITLWSLGVIVAAFRGFSAVLIYLSGPWVDRMGALRSMRVSAGLAAVSLGGIAAFSTGPVSLTAWLLFASGSLALGTPAVNRLLMKRVGHGSQGIAFGVKNAGAPLATLIAGVAVPLVALTFGWRWVFAAMGAGALSLAVLIPRGPAHVHRAQASMKLLPTGKRVPSGARIQNFDLALAFGLSMASASSLPTFLADYAVSAGLSEGRAGWTVAAGSIAAIVTRIASGRMLDSYHLTGLGVPASMVLAGVIGFAMLATGDARLVLPGAIIAFALGWGFNAVFWVAVLRLSDASPALVTSSIMPGGLIGGLVGPLVFGFLAGGFGYRYAWLSSAVLGILGAGAMLLRQRRSRAHGVL